MVAKSERSSLYPVISSLVSIVIPQQPLTNSTLLRVQRAVKNQQIIEKAAARAWIPTHRVPQLLHN
jgi:hypothetical protein